SIRRHTRCYRDWSSDVCSSDLDEILWRAYQASWVYWLIGVFTAFLTSFYMFRLLFLTFFGEYRGSAGAGLEYSAGRGSHGAPGHGAHGHIDESPTVTLPPLAVVASLSVVAGRVGLPASVGRGDELGQYLDPVLPRPARGVPGA